MHAPDWTPPPLIWGIATDSGLPPGLLEQLPAGADVILASASRLIRYAHTAPGRLIAIIPLSRELPYAELGRATREGDLTWIGWETPPSADLRAAAREARAVIMASSVIPADDWLSAARELVDARAAALAPPIRQRPYRRGESIAMHQSGFLRVDRGIVGLWITYDDGARGLFGLHGAGRIVPVSIDGLPGFEVSAHTEAHVTEISCATADQTPLIAGAIRQSTDQLWAWIEARERGAQRDRIMGVLELLAASFGVPHRTGTLVDVRLTHDELAAAVRAARSTVTGLLGDLQRTGELTTAGTSGARRFVIHAGPR